MTAMDQTCAAGRVNWRSGAAVGEDKKERCSSRKRGPATERVVGDTGRMAELFRAVTEMQRCNACAARSRPLAWSARRVGKAKMAEAVAHPHDSLQQCPREVGSGSGRKLWS
jgi:hypothetical protein